MPADRVHVDMKFVRNLGNFESVHVSLGVEVDVAPDQTTKEALDLWYARIEATVQEKVKQIDEEAGKENTVYHHRGN
jgi:hypothetical protein